LMFSPHGSFLRRQLSLPCQKRLMNLLLHDPGTRVILLVQEGGIPAAYGKVSDIQPDSWGVIRVKVASRNRVLIEVDSLVVPSAAAILHRLSGQHTGKTKAGSLTLRQLQDASNSITFQVVAPISHLQLDVQDTVSGLHFPHQKENS
jgi:hypothetical protein